MTDTATARVQWVYRCQHPTCTNAVSVATCCPLHLSPWHFHRLVSSAPVFEASATWAALRGELRRERARA